MSIAKVVTRIVDGDTINVEPFPDGEDSVRLLGIDTPETNYNGHSQGEHADAAKTFLQQLIPIGDTVDIETGLEERDKYGRVLAYVFKDDENINVRLVAEGLAAPYQIYPNLRYSHDIRQAAIDALSQGKGIFDPADPLPKLPFEFRMRVDNRTSHKYVGNTLTNFYYDPSQYKQVALENRVFFFTKSDAVKGGYVAQPRRVPLASIVDKPYESFVFSELLQAPVSALEGVSEQDEELLHKAFGIKTIADLADNKYFKWAQAIKSLAQ